jgi:hypothetical protein
VIVVVALAGLLALMLNRHVTTAAGSGKQASAGGAAIREQAAAWVAGQVSQVATVACDPQMCQALKARGIPAADLLELRRGAADPLSASVIIATPAVRRIAAAPRRCGGYRASCTCSGRLPARERPEGAAARRRGRPAGGVRGAQPARIAELAGYAAITGQPPA